MVNDPELAERSEIIWEKGTNRKKFFRGQVDKYTWVDLGSSYLPSEMTSAFLFAQLEKAEEIIADRCRSLGLYMEGLADLDQQGRLRLPNIELHGTCNGHIMYIITGSLEERTALIEHLKQKEIHSVFHYVPLHSAPMGRSHCRTSGSLDVTNQVSECLLRLPLYYGMYAGDVSRVVDEIKAFYAAN